MIPGISTVGSLPTSEQNAVIQKLYPIPQQAPPIDLTNPYYLILMGIAVGCIIFSIVTALITKRNKKRARTNAKKAKLEQEKREKLK